MSVYDYAIETPSALADVRARVRTLFASTSPETVSNLELVCTELAANALEHAAGPRRLRLFHCGVRKIRVEVDDASPDELPTPGRSRVGSFRGRGMQLINALARWGVHRDRNSKTVWAEILSD